MMPESSKAVNVEKAVGGRLRRIGPSYLEWPICQDFLLMRKAEPAP